MKKLLTKPKIDEDLAAKYANKLQKMICCKTVSSKDGYVPDEFDKLRRETERLFPLLHKNAELKIFGNDCWLYSLPGHDESKCIVLMSHHDVVEASGNWKHEPFGGIVENGKIYGRGTVDTKTPLFAEMQAIEEMLENGEAFPCRVYLASSHNEEYCGDGMKLVLEYFKENKIIPALVLDEGGAVIDAPMPGLSCKCAMLAIHEKGRHTLNLTAKKILEHTGLAGAHTTPPLQIARFMLRLEKEKPCKRKFAPQVLAMFCELSPYMAQPMRFIFKNIKLFKGVLAAVIPRLNPQAGAMLGTTYTFNELNTDKNADCTLKMLLRCVDENDLKQELAKIEKIAARFDISAETDEALSEFHKPSSLDGHGYKFVKECVQKCFPYAACAPYILPAGTDARQFCDICDNVIRFAPIDISNEQLKSVHGENENIDIDAIPRAVMFYKTVLREFR